MTIQTKRRLWLLAVAALVFVVWREFRHWTPEERLRSLFSELSLENIDYETLHLFDQPKFAIKGDFFILEITQSEKQLRELLAKLKLSQENFLSSTGVLIRSESRLSPNYPWWLEIKAHATNAPAESYRVRIEGRQIYD